MASIDDLFEGQDCFLNGEPVTVHRVAPKIPDPERNFTISEYDNWEDGVEVRRSNGDLFWLEAIYLST